jgi:hypothetical protein
MAERHFRDRRAFGSDDTHKQVRMLLRRIDFVVPAGKHRGCAGMQARAMR